jgi:TRAP-type mannitol/chloroaromatic compound transport system substrate-binding protein
MGGDVLRRLGAVVVTLPGGEIIPSLRSGAIDASEFVGPWIDMALGLHKAAKYYYYPGFHEPGAAVSLAVNKKLSDSLGSTEKTGCRCDREHAFACGVHRRWPSGDEVRARDLGGTPTPSAFAL